MLTDRDQIRAIASSTPTAISLLQLCQAAYACDPDDIPEMVAGVTPLTPGGYWVCSWGPAIDEDDANLVFVATYAAGSGEAPSLAAVVLRGTNFDVQDPLGILIQAFEDLDVLHEEAYPYLSGSLTVARGTLDALTTIHGLVAGGQTLHQYLTAFYAEPANADTALAVTGHSLGGCLTTVVAPWLNSALGLATPSPIFPTTFAAPTAGDGNFASAYAAAFPNAIAYVNSLDVVPNAWASLDELRSIYDTCGIDTPLLISGILDLFGVLMVGEGVTYVQPPVDIVPLAGSCEMVDPSDPPDWYDEALYQHHTTTYLALLGGSVATAGQVAPLHRRRNRRRLGVR